MSGVVGGWLSLPSPWEVGLGGGESGRNELLRGPFAAYFPGQVFAGDGRLRRRFSHTGHGPFRALIVSNLKWGGPCRSHYVFPASQCKIQ